NPRFSWAFFAWHGTCLFYDANKWARWRIDYESQVNRTTDTGLKVNENRWLILIWQAGFRVLARPGVVAGFLTHVINSTGYRRGSASWK
ncbi:MAG: hypothetical protein VXY51_08080, partial [Pseudomonadota bacterium]|nr:hypothetical protein [Pseudomonadota bacterium]